MKNIRIINVWVVLFLLPLACSCQMHEPASPEAEKTTEDYVARIHDLAKAYADCGDFSGAILVGHEGQVIYKHGFALADIDARHPNQPTTQFRLASVSKQFTTMLIMKLVAEKKLNLHEPISTYIPDYPAAVAGKVTLHHLMTHTSGIPSYTDFPDYWDNMDQAITPKDLVACFADSPLQFEPGDRFRYSNSGYALLGFIMEKVTGKSYSQLLKEYIFLPLDMHNSGMRYKMAANATLAIGYNNQFGEQARPIDMSRAYAAGGIHSSVEDLYKWDQALYSDEFLSSEYRELLFEKHIPAWGQHYGYGWEIGTSRAGNGDLTVKSILHDGVINGFSSIIVRIPESKSTVILLHNAGGAPLREMSRAILGVLFKQPYSMPQPTTASQLYELIESEGLESALSAYDTIKENGNYRTDERKMNELGYHYLEQDKVAEAIAVFQINTEQFPTSGNAYDSYAEALAKAGQTEQAITFYKKSLYFDPRSENGKDQLKKLGVEIDEADLYIVPTPDNWQTEIFPFPLRFAPKVSFMGKEEAHFPANWRNGEHDEFWSYLIVWDIDDTTAWTDDSVNAYLETYYDGLMAAVDRGKTPDMPATKGSLKQSSEHSFEGMIEIFDAFVTHDRMTLRVEVDQRICAKTEKSIVFFKISPKQKGHPIWAELSSYVQASSPCH